MKSFFKMADWTVYQFKPSHYCALADGFDLFLMLNALHFFIRAKRKIDPVGVVNQFLCFFHADQFWKVSANFIA